MYWLELLVFQFPVVNGCRGLFVTSRVLLTLSIHGRLKTCVHVRKSAKSVLLAEGDESDLGEFFLCMQKMLDLVPVEEKKPQPVEICTLKDAVMAPHCRLWGKTSGSKRRMRRIRQGIWPCLGYEGLPSHACKGSIVWG